MVNSQQNDKPVTFKSHYAQTFQTPNTHLSQTQSLLAGEHPDDHIRRRPYEADN